MWIDGCASGQSSFLAVGGQTARRDALAGCLRPFLASLRLREDRGSNMPSRQAACHYYDRRMAIVCFGRQKKKDAWRGRTKAWSTRQGRALPTALRPHRRPRKATKRQRAVPGHQTAPRAAWPSYEAQAAFKSSPGRSPNPQPARSLEESPSRHLPVSFSYSAIAWPNSIRFRSDRSASQALRARL